MLESFCNGAGAARQAEAVRAQRQVLLERAERDRVKHGVEYGPGR